MPTEIAGTISMFGQQVLSTKTTAERARIGTETRKDISLQAPYLLGATSTGVATKVQSGFGAQTASRCTTAPSHRFGNRYQSDNDMVKEGRPGPGSYELPHAVGRQTQSNKPSNPSWRVSTGNRFSTYKNVWKEDFQTPAANSWRPSSGWLGDSPHYSFHGNARRADVQKGLPGNSPTSIADPGPGSYELPGAMGNQQDSRRSSAWHTRVGTAQREAIRSSQYLGQDQQTELLGKHSPAPNAYNPTHCLTKTSRVQTPCSFRFGSSDRFSQVKPRDKQKRLPGPATPGPGSYVV